jgi:TorA maturation chaperone TorD
MRAFKINPATALFLRFYARCFTFPYEEMGYELQYLFRQIELLEIEEDDQAYLEQILNVINHYQGEDLNDLRASFVSLFTQWENGNITCPILASQFTKSHHIKYNSDVFVDLLIDSDIPADTEDSMDSIVNYLEYFSVICDPQIKAPAEKKVLHFYKNHILTWIPQFCDLLFRYSNISFYKEVAIGLSEYLLQTGEYD